MTPEIAILTPIQPNPLQPVQGYRVEQPPVLLNAQGGMDVCPDYFPLLPATAADVDAYVEVQSGTHRIFVSQRAMEPTKWHTDYDGAVVKWLQRGSHVGGNAFMPNLRVLDGFGTPQMIHYNPTLGGSKQDPYREDKSTFYSSVPLWFSATPKRIATAVIPLDWRESTAVAGDDKHPPIWWRMRQVLIVEPEWAPNVHRITFWQYAPFPWGPKNAIAGWLTQGIAVPSRLFDRAFFADVKTETVLDLPEWAPPPTKELKQRWSGFTDHLERSGDKINAGGPSPFASGYAAAAMVRQSDGFCVAAAMRLAPDGRRMRLATELDLLSAYGKSGTPGFPRADPETDDEACLIEISAKVRENRMDGVSAGWIGHSFFAFVGNVSGVTPAMRDLYRSGALDLPPERSDIPVLAGVSPP